MWRGHPGALNDEIIEKHLDGAVRAPMWEWAPSHKDVRQALSQRQYAKALAAAKKLGESDGGKVIVDAIQGKIATTMAQLEVFREAGDHLRARDLARDLEQQLDGLPEAKKAADVLSEIAESPEIQAVIEGQERLKAIYDSFATLERSDVGSVIATLEQLASEYPDTIVASHAEETIEMLRAAGRSGR